MQANSPCIEKAAETAELPNPFVSNRPFDTTDGLVELPNVNTDYWGVSHYGDPDIGAREYTMN